MPACSRLFAYGTLRFEPVMRILTGRVPRARDAALDDHACYLARHGRFPGLAPESGERTEGRVWLGVDVHMLAVLDVFESDLFERRVMSVEADGRRIDAWVYLLGPPHRHLLGPRRFDAHAFERERLPAWLARLRGG